VVNYKAPISPLEQATIQRYVISDLDSDAIQKTINGYSAFYIPPKDLLPISEPTLLEPIHEASAIYPHVRLDPPGGKASEFYDPKEVEAVSRL